MVEREQAQAQAALKKTTLQFVLFGLVGVLNTAVDLFVYWALLQLSVYYIAANVLSYAAGMLNSYVWNKYLTFRSKEKKESGKRERGTLLRFLLWNSVTLLLSSGLIALFIELAHWSELWSKLVATVVILVIQFTGMKKWVFRQ